MNDTPKIIFMPYISTYWMEKKMREAINRWWNRKDESWFRKAVNYLRRKLIVNRHNSAKRKYNHTGVAKVDGETARVLLHKI